MAAANDPPPGDPPPTTSRLEGLNSSRNKRTIPKWMDRTQMHGERIILLMSAADENKPLPRNPFVIAKSVDRTCGKIESANTEQKGTKYVLKVRNAEQAKKLLALKELIDGTEIIITPHPTLSKSRCVVTCREVIDMCESDIQEELAAQGVIEVRRITRMEGGRKVNTSTLILTLNATVVPEQLNFGLLRIPTRLYYPSPMLCYNCCCYGHTRNKCSKAPVCNNCSESHDSENNDCNKQPHCKNCNDSHPPTHKKCPVYMQEEKIIKIKVESGISFSEARKEYSRLTGDGSYASVSGAQARLKKMAEESAKDREILELKSELSKIRNKVAKSIDITKQYEEMEKLRKEVEQLRKIAEQYERIKGTSQFMTQREKETACKDLIIGVPRERHDVSPSGTKRTQPEVQTTHTDRETSNNETFSAKEKIKNVPPRAKRGRPRKNL